MSPRLPIAAAAALCLLTAVGVGLYGGVASAAQDPNDALPEGAGKALILRACTGCHDASVISDKPRTADDWDYVLGRMMQNGAELTAEEQDTLAAYLVKNFGKAAPPAPAPAPDAKSPQSR
jgi:cytochrome c5